MPHPFTSYRNRVPFMDGSIPQHPMAPVPRDHCGDSNYKVAEGDFFDYSVNNSTHEYHVGECNTGRPARE